MGAVGGQPVYVDCEGHSLTIGQSGEGKFSSAIAPMLLHDVSDARGVPAGFVVVDPKNGEAAKITSLYRRLLREERVFVIDPYGKAGGGDALNPFDFLDPAAPDFQECCSGLANALVVPRPKDRRSGDFFWDSVGAMWLTAMIAHLALAPDEERTIRRLRSVFSQTQEGLLEVLLAMEDNPRSPQWVRDASRTMQRVLLKAEKEASGYLATISEATKFADSALVSKVLDRSTFDPIVVRRDGATVYLVSDDEYLPQSAPWLRLTCEIMRQRIKRSPVERQVHWLIDEAKAFESWSFIEQGLRAMRGFGMSLHLFYQNVGQIRGVWGDGWTAITDARLIRFLGSNDVETLKWIAELCGEITVIDYSRGENRFETTGRSHTRGATHSTSEAHGASHSSSLTNTASRSRAASQGESEALAMSFSRQHGVSHGHSRTYGTGWSFGKSFSTTEGNSSQSSNSSSATTGWGASSGSGPGGANGSSNFNFSSTTSDSSSESHSFSFSEGSNSSKSGHQSSAFSDSWNSGHSSGNSSTKTKNTGQSLTDSASRAKGESTGKTYTRTASDSRSETDSDNSSSTEGASATYAERRRLMTVDEVRRMSGQSVLVFVNREPDCLIDRVHYFKCPPLLRRVLAGMVAFPIADMDEA